MDTSTHPRIKKMSLQLLVADMERSVDFYTKLLGFNIDFQYDDFYTGIIKDGSSIHLKTGCSSVEERANKRQNNDLDIIFSIHDIEELYQELLSKSVDIIQPLREMPYGKEFYIADPDGYIIGYIQEPYNR